MHALHARSMKSHTPTPAQGQNCARLPNHVIISLTGTAYTAVYPIAQSGDLTAALASDEDSLPLDLAHARALRELQERCWSSILKWRKVGTRLMVQVSIRPHTRAHTLHMNLFSTPFHIHTYEDVLFIQVCSDPTPLHSSTVQGEFINHCSVLPC